MSKLRAVLWTGQGMMALAVLSFPFWARIFPALDEVRKGRAYAQFGSDIACLIVGLVFLPQIIQALRWLLGLFLRLPFIAYYLWCRARLAVALGVMGTFFVVACSIGIVAEGAVAYGFAIARELYNQKRIVRAQALFDAAALRKHDGFLAARERYAAIAGAGGGAVNTKIQRMLVQADERINMRRQFEKETLDRLAHGDFRLAVRLAQELDSVWPYGPPRRDIVLAMIQAKFNALLADLPLLLSACDRRDYSALWKHPYGTLILRTSDMPQPPMARGNAAAVPAAAVPALEHWCTEAAAYPTVEALRAVQWESVAAP